VTDKMQPWKHSLVNRFLLLILLALLFSEQARAQVLVDVSKITCNQFVTYKIENPKYIIAWLAGYYHGTRRDMTVDLHALIADADKVEAYCFTKPEVPLVEAMKTVLGISIGP
jgi:acid stress chaperone HdeB